MVLGEIMRRFVDQRPMAVLVRAILERQFADSFFDATFAELAKKQFTLDLAFSTCARIMAQVTLGQSPSVHSAFLKDRESIPVSVGSLYEKLQHVELAVCEGLVDGSACSLGAVIALLGQNPEPIAGFRSRIVDGNVLASCDHRIKELRGTGVAAMPGKSLVLYDYATGLISELVACEDGEASERRLLPQLFTKIYAGDLIIADRNFCTADMLTKVHELQAAFLIRHHAALHLTMQGQPKKRGRCKTGEVSEQTVSLQCGLVCRAIIITRDKPLKNGGCKVVLLTNVTNDKATAVQLANLYLERWKIEEAFRQLTQYLSCEVRTLGYPKAALFAFTMAVLAYNTLACLKAALRAAHEQEEDNWSSFYIAWEVKVTFEGMLIATTAEEWQPFAAMTNEQFAAFLRETAGNIDPARYRKSKRGPKKTPERKKVRSKHVSTLSILTERGHG